MNSLTEPIKVAALEWTKEQISDEHRHDLRSLPWTTWYRFGSASLQLLHGGTRKLDEWYGQEYPHRLTELAERTAVDILVIGHTHQQFAVEIVRINGEKTLIINPGAVGRSIDSEFPVTKEAAAHARCKGLHVAMGAPNALQGRSLSGNLSALEAIGERLVDILATDYYPASMLQAAFAIVKRGILPLHEAVKLVSENVADGLKLTDRGQLVPGRIADIVLLDDTGTLPRVHGTLRHGVPVYWDRFMSARSHFSGATYAANHSFPGVRSNQVATTA